MGKSREQKEQQRINLQLSRDQSAQARQAAETQRALLAQQQKIYGQISPFALSSMQMGQDALQGKVPDAFTNAYLLPARNALSKSFSQSRENLIQALGQSGQYGSGISVGPLANLETEQSRAVGDVEANSRLAALQQALSMGFQGANLLGGQQAIFNPVAYGNLSNQYAGTALQDPRQYARAGTGLIGALGGAGLGTLGSIYAPKGA